MAERRYRGRIWVGLVLIALGLFLVLAAKNVKGKTSGDEAGAVLFVVGAVCVGSGMRNRRRLRRIREEREIWGRG